MNTQKRKRLLIHIYLHARMHNLVVRKELMMQKTEDEKKFLRIRQEWEHRWKDLPLIIAGKEVGAEVVP